MKDPENRWAELAGADAAGAYRTMRELLATPRPTVELLAKRMHPVTAVEAKRTAKLLAELDSHAFATREKAAKELARLGTTAEPALRRALAGRPPLEARRRIENLLRSLDRQRVGLSRGIELLERLNTPQARKLLSVLAGGEREARLTQEARETLARLLKQSPSP